jgi:hypothetical protein
MRWVKFMRDQKALILDIKRVAMFDMLPPQIGDNKK